MCLFYGWSVILLQIDISYIYKIGGFDMDERSKLQQVDVLVDKDELYQYMMEELLSLREAK